MSQKFTIPKSSDRIYGNVRTNAIAAIANLDPNKAHRVELSEYRAPRTQDANAYLWACAYPLIVRELGFTAEEWHEEMCMRYFGKRAVEKPGGRTESLPVRTTTTNEAGKRDVVPGLVFWEFVEMVRRDAAGGGVFIPDPDPFWKESRERAA
jgi:hypothetical protein